MWTPNIGIRHKRKRLFENTPSGPLRDYYSVPFADAKSPVRDARIVSLDFETTGLNPESDHIVSIGLVHIQGLSIKLGTAWHEVVYTARDMPEETTVIHQITDDAVGQARHISDLLPDLLKQLQGNTLLVHHAAIESGFLDVVCNRLYQSPFEIPIIDTEVLARRQFERQQLPVLSGQLRLYNLSKRYHLPAYKAHNALSDALATAELFLALAHDICPKLNCPLKDFIC